MKIASSVFQIKLVAGETTNLNNFTNLNIQSSLGVFRIKTPTNNFVNSISGDVTISDYIDISADGTTPDGAINAPAGIEFEGTDSQDIDIECLVDGILNVIIEK